MFLVSSKIFNSIHIHSFHFRQPNPTQPILRNISIRKNEEREGGGRGYGKVNHRNREEDGRMG